jgi:hypothetical protein
MTESANTATPADDMASAIERLRASEQTEAAEDREAGAQAGRAWAKHKAKARQLRRLSEANDHELFRGEPDSYGWAGVLHHAMHAGKCSDRDELGIFWERVLGDDAERVEDMDFAEGFVDGALEVWDEYQLSGLDPL